MISTNYEDEKKHVHVLSYGGGTQSTALLLMALKGEVNGVIPDYIIFCDTGWESEATYNWVNKINQYIKLNFNKEIIRTCNGNIRKDIAQAKKGHRMATLPYYTKDKEGKKGILRRQCTYEYKILPMRREIRKQLGYAPRKRVKEIVHLWKGISTDEVQRMKPSPDKWMIAEHPLIEILDKDRSNCISYVEKEGLGTPEQSSCIGCPFHNNEVWRDLKKNSPHEFLEVIEVDKTIRNLIPNLDSQLFLHKSCMPLDEIDFGDNQLSFIDDDFNNECEGLCGV